MPRSSRQPKHLQQRFRPDDSEVDTESEAESVSDYQATSNSEDDRCSTPDSQKDSKCVVCQRNVNSSDKSLQCDTCSEWCHIKCGGVTKEHYRQMVALDESNIELTWECPPCHKKNNPSPAPPSSPDEPPQQTVAKIPPRPKTKPSETIPVTAPKPSAMVPILPKPVPTPSAGARYSVTMTSNGVNKSQTNGVNDTPGRLSFPDVRIRDLPFYPVKATLLRPCVLTPKVKDSTDTQNQGLAFYLTQEQANIVNNGRKVETNGMVVYKMHILLRFTKVSSDGIQDDDFPKNLVLKVNNKICPLPNPKPVPANRPNMEAKRPPKPLIITSLCKLNTKSCLNQVSVTWVPRKDDSPYTISIYLVEKLSPDDLLKKLKLRGQRDPQVTRNVIAAKLEDKDDEISTSSVKVTMACPLSMMRINFPCRASTCDHLQCFDADMYIRMNEKKPKWVCPVCNKPAYFEHLFLDGFYIQLLLSPKFKALSTNEIILNNDASWEAVEAETLGVSDSDDDYEDPIGVARPKQTSAPSNGAIDDDDDISVIPISTMTDADGAPILTSTAIPTNVPVNTFLASNNMGGTPGSPRLGMTNNTSLVNVDKDLEDDVLVKKKVAPELDYMDWNYSVKFFHFLRDPPPPRRSPTPPPSPAADSNSISEISDSGASTKTLEQFVYSKRGRGRGGARGGARGRGAKAKVVTTEDEDDIPTKVVGGGGVGRGRGRGRGRGGARGKAPVQSKRRRVETSEEESEPSDSESEEEVLSRPAPSRSSGRSARNTKRVNYAAIEDSFEVLDSLIG